MLQLGDSMVERRLALVEFFCRLRVAAIIDDGRAAAALDTLVRVTNTPIDPEAA